MVSTFLCAQLHLILCGPMDCSLPGFSVQGILQARVLECVAFPSSRGSSQPRDQTQVSRIAGRFFTIWATREALRHTRKDGCVTCDGGGNCSDSSTSQGMPKIAGKRQKPERQGSSPSGFTGNVALTTIWFWTSSPHNYDTRNFCRFKTPSW